MSGGQKRQILALVFLGAASLYLTWSLVTLAQDVQLLMSLQQRRGYDTRKEDDFSYVGSDHPTRLPIEEKLVKLVVQESVHYGISDPESADEWLWTASVGDGHVRIGKDERMFAVVAFHELHCLRSMRSAIQNGWQSLPLGRQRHILHCYNYLRQWTLCAGDATLEPGDFMQRNFTKHRIGATHTCVDWLPAYEMMKDKWLEWEQFRKSHGIAHHDVD
ncbi:hypothetical protein CVT24_006880 [Panaeolus cyanescens]|uniref:DUF3328 domain-containing protein n=1 Tax=Panaeolus cyanescens TaxID=181874 RepID=A0A409YWZ4_9AGAR|nr:hypothetical protein CVT24_006880 [Panaeolus cyanescens]